MVNNKLKVYAAGGWFGPNQEEVLTSIENLLRNNPHVTPYFPRHDGVKLAPGEIHDSSLRRAIFEDNVEHIRSSDVVVAACDGRDGVYDTGTQWEIGYAMANNIPVIAYDTTHNIYTNMKSIVRGFHTVCHTLEELDHCINVYAEEELLYVQNKMPLKILFVGPDITEEHQENNKDIISSVILECHGSNFRWVDDLTVETLYDSVDDVFKGIDYMISVIDDRHPIVSWMMGQAYSRDIPIITYTNYDYGINLMLGMSIHYHCKGKQELKNLMQKLKRDGIYSVEAYDTSGMKMQ